MSAGNAAPINGRTIAIIAMVSIVAFVAYLLLSAYEGDIRPIRDPGGHALSNSAVGFSGAVQLVGLTGGTARISRAPGDIYSPGLMVLTPTFATDPDELKRFVERRDGLMTLIILPKHFAVELRRHPGWVRVLGQPEPELLGKLVKGIADVTVYGSGQVRAIRGAKLQTILSGPTGGALLAKVDGSNTFILADPDALDNMGLKDIEGVRRARVILDAVEIRGAPVLFDVTLAGLANPPSLLKLAFEPPYLPFTLCLALATLLAALHAARRFGPPAHEERKIALGKRAIAENGAALLRLARRRHRTGARYAALTRDAAAAATGAPPGLRGADLDRYLDRLDPTGEPFSAMAARAAAANDTRALMSAVRALYQWKRTVTRDHQ